MISKLPHELQELVWKKYFSSFVCYEISLLRLETSLYENMSNKCYTMIDNLIHVALNIFNRSVIEFNMVLDFLEDRLFDDIWNPDGIYLLYIIKHYINTPSLLKIELSKHCTYENEYKRAPSRLEFKDAYHCRLNYIKIKTNNINTIWCMMKGAEDETDDDEYLQNDFN
jgi:hypothetical protein